MRPFPEVGSQGSADVYAEDEHGRIAFFGGAESEKGVDCFVEAAEVGEQFEGYLFPEAGWGEVAAIVRFEG